MANAAPAPLTPPIVPPMPRAEIPVEIFPVETTARIEEAKPKTAVVKLERHYRPADGTPLDIVGHWVPKVERKNAAGKMELVTPETFVPGEPMPPPLAGVGTASPKLWAGTVARFPLDEAKRIRANGIGTIEVDDYN